LKKQKKIFLKLAVCILLMIMTVMPTLAQSIVNENMDLNAELCAVIDINKYYDEIIAGEKIILPDGAILTPISKSEYISRLAKEKKITVEEAYELELDDAVLARNSMVSYVDYTKNFTYSENSNYNATLLATVKIRKWQGGAAQIENVLSVSSQRRSGLYEYRWIETDAFSDPVENSSSYPVTSVVLTAKGYFEVVVDISVEGSVNLPGFGVGGSVGSVITYISDNMVMRSTFSVY
jgi:hypothetical protein